MAQDIADMVAEGVGLIFVCELIEVHQGRAKLPIGWQKIGAGEFQLLYGQGWFVNAWGLRRVWPDDTPQHATKGWRRYLQVAPAAVVVVVVVVAAAAAGGSTGSSSR